MHGSIPFSATSCEVSLLQAFKYETHILFGSSLRGYKPRRLVGVCLVLGAALEAVLPPPETPAMPLFGRQHAGTTPRNAAAHWITATDC